MTTTTTLTENLLDIEIRSKVEQYMTLWTAHRIEEHSKLLTEDADLVNVIGQHLHGREAIQGHHEHLHSTIFAQSSSRIVNLIIQSVADGIALVHMHWEMKGAARLPGWNVPEPRTGVMSQLWVRQQGEWRVRALQNTDAIPMPPLPNA